MTTQSNVIAENKNVGRVKKKKSGQLIWYVVLLPYLIAMAIFSLGPAVYAVLLSFARVEGGVPKDFSAGLENFKTAYTHFKFIDSFINIAKFAFFSVLFGLVMVLIISLLLDMRRNRTSSLFRAIYFLPGALSGVGAVLMFTFVLDPEVSAFGAAVRLLGPDLRTIVQSGNLVYLFTVLQFYLGAGTWVAILIGSLTSISHEVMDAATIDGCNAWQRALYIKLPALRPVIAYFVILAFAGNVQLYTEPDIAGHAWGAPSGSWAPNQVAYWFAFERGNFGAAAALALLMMFIGLIGAYFVITRTGLYDIERS